MTPDELRTTRTALGLTIIALADRLGVHRHTIQNWESGRTRIPQSAILAIAAMERFGPRKESA